MRFERPSRPAVIALVLAALATLSATSARAQDPEGARNAAPPPRVQTAQAQHPAPSQEHLPQWMERHSNLSLSDQQKALSQEPGFRDLPSETQQRMLDDLVRLNRMTPEQRRRMLARNEALEHLSPQLRAQVLSALAQLGALPVDRRYMVAQAFRNLRALSASARQSMLNSPQYRSQFNNEERATLSNLLAVEPYIPIQRQQQPNVSTGPGRP
ncbi:MAG: DUF3106 domain-containing protein [Acidobacteriaceae bacterium]|nr:DUF3106 domain-containing protein [Acidobacteriaceae bacterium]